MEQFNTNLNHFLPVNYTIPSLFKIFITFFFFNNHFLFLLFSFHAYKWTLEVSVEDNILPETIWTISSLTLLNTLTLVTSSELNWLGIPMTHTTESILFQISTTRFSPDCLIKDKYGIDLCRSYICHLIINVLKITWPSRQK